MEKEKNGRLVWIDISKGVAILLVLIGHSMRDEMRVAYPFLDALYRSIYIFHMTWFFWLAGYGYRLSRNKGRIPLQIAGKRLRMQFPYWIIYTLFIYVAFSLAMKSTSLSSILSDAGYFKIDFIPYITSAILANNPWAFHLWFLWVLIIITVIVCLFDSLTNSRHTTLVCIFLIVIGLAGIAFRDKISLGDWWFLFSYISLYLPVFCLGILMADMKFSDTLAWIWGILGLIYIIVRVRFFSGFSGNSLNVEGWTRFAVYCVGYTMLPGLMVLLGKVFEKRLFPISESGMKRLVFLGKESLVIYLIHQPLCCAFMGTVLYNELRMPALIVMSICIAMSLVLSIIAVYLKRKLEKTLIRQDA